MLYQKDPKYAHLPHSEWLKTPDGERWRQASSQYGNPTARTLDLRPEDRIRDLMGRRPVSHGKGPPPDKPPKPEPPKSAGCFPVCDGQGNQTRRACQPTPDPNCKRKGDFDGVPLPPNWGPRIPLPREGPDFVYERDPGFHGWLPYGDTDFVFRRDGVNVDVRPR
jgi:hypothetical protein